MYKTPLLIYVGGESFKAYIGSLSKSAKKNYKYAEKHNSDLVFKRVEFNPELIGSFMDLWGMQEMAGRSISLGISKGFVKYLSDKGYLLVFAARERESDETLALHFVERHGEYVECYPPMLDKVKYADRYLSKYMWFHLIEFAISDSEMKWLDLGGGFRGTWRDLLINREETSTSYKWMYVPRDVKANPENERPCMVKVGAFRYGKYLVESTQPENRLKHYLSRKIIAWFWNNKRNRLRKFLKKFGN